MSSSTPIRFGSSEILLPRLDDYIAKLRKGQQNAVSGVLESIRSGQKRSHSVVIPTRYGKSDVIRLLAIEVRRLGLCTGTIAISPSTVLRDQLISSLKINAMCGRLGFSHASTIAKGFVSLAGNVWESSTLLSDRIMLSATAQIMSSRVENLDEYLMRSDRRLPTLVLIDESHEVGTLKKRGELFQTLINCGCFIVMFTATPFRSDNDEIPGFEYQDISERSRFLYKVIPECDGEKRKIEKSEYKETGRQVVPDTETSLQAAYDESTNENPILCKLTVRMIDIQVKRIDGSSYLLHNCKNEKGEVEVSKSRKLLGQVFFHKKTRKSTFLAAAKLCVNDVIMRRNDGATGSAAIIFVGNDLNEVKNEYAEEIKEILEQLYFEMTGVRPSAIIVTGEDEDAANVLRRFSELGEFDFLIVKQMAGAGLDAPRVKTVVDLSPVRTPASCIQRWMRCATPWVTPGGKLQVTGTLIMVRDPIGDQIFQRGIREEGGEFVPHSLVTSPPVFVELYEKEIDEEKTNSEGLDKVTGAQNGAILDHVGSEISRDVNPQLIDAAERVLALVPGLLTLPEVVNAMQATTSVLPAKASTQKRKKNAKDFSSTGDKEIAEARKRLNKAIRRTCILTYRLKHGKGQVSDDELRIAFAHYQNPIRHLAYSITNNETLKRSCWMDGSPTVAKITDVERMRDMALFVSTLTPENALNAAEQCRKWENQ